MAGLASGSIFTNHWVDSIGSTTVSQRWQWPTACTCGFEPALEAQLVEPGLDRLAGREAVHPRERSRPRR